MGMLMVDGVNYSAVTVVDADNNSGTHTVDKTNLVNTTSENVQGTIEEVDKLIGNVSDISTIGNGTITGSIVDLSNKVGSVDISGIGDGTITGAIQYLLGLIQGNTGS